MHSKHLKWGLVVVGLTVGVGCSEDRAPNLAIHELYSVLLETLEKHQQSEDIDELYGDIGRIRESSVRLARESKEQNAEVKCSSQALESKLFGFESLLRAMVKEPARQQDSSYRAVLQQHIQELRSYAQSCIATQKR